MHVSEKPELYKTALSTMWFDDQGIFHSVTKKNIPITKEGLEQTFEFIRYHRGNEKVCWLGDMSDASFPTVEARDYAGVETPKIIKALALVTNSTLSKLIANVFLTLKKPSYPVKMFTSRDTALEWLRQHI